MKNKYFRLYLIFNISIAIISFAVLVVLWNNNEAYKGNVQGTNFVYEQKPVAGSMHYDADSTGKLYFAGDGVILVWGNDEKYLYTLPINMHGGQLSVLIDNNDNITVYDARGNDINIYNQNGFLINVQHGNDNDLLLKYFTNYNSERKKPDGTVYKKDGDIITKTVNGVTKVVFTIPVWQKVDYYCFNVLIISLITLFAGIFGAYWKKNFYDPKKQIQRQLDKGRN